MKWGEIGGSIFVFLKQWSIQIFMRSSLWLNQDLLQRLPKKVHKSAFYHFSVNYGSYRILKRVAEICTGINMLLLFCSTTPSQIRAEKHNRFHWPLPPGDCHNWKWVQSWYKSLTADRILFPDWNLRAAAFCQWYRGKPLCWSGDSNHRYHRDFPPFPDTIPSSGGPVCHPNNPPCYG